MAQQQIKGATGTVDGSGSLTTYEVPGTAVITPYSISVTADASGASGAFLPCLTFRTITGAIIARCPAPEVASGTAEVSWFPHVAQPTTSGGSGIQFDTDPQTGDWLHVKTTGAGGDQNNGQEFFSTGGAIVLRSLGTSGPGSPGDFSLVAADDFDLITGDQINLATGPHSGYSGTGDNINISSAIDVNIDAAGQSSVTAQNDVFIESAESGGAGDILIQVGGAGTGNVIMQNLPAADPHVFGALWVDGSNNVQQSQG